MPDLFAGAQFCFKRSPLAKTADAENAEPDDLSMLDVDAPHQRVMRSFAHEPGSIAEPYF